MPQHLLRRNNRWYVRVAVPRPLWDVVGRREIQRTTGTPDIKLAERRKHAIIAEIRDEIDALGGPENDPRSHSWLKSQMRAIRNSQRRGELDELAASWMISHLQDKHLAAHGTDREDPNVPAELVTRLRDGARLASDLEFQPLSDLIETYLSERKGRVVDSTLHVKRRELEAFLKWLPGDPAVYEVDRKITGRYVSEVLAKSDSRSPKTQKAVVSALSAFWNWCIRKGLYERANPWSGLGEDLKGSTRGGSNGKEPRRPWKAEELAKIATIERDDPMFPLCMISAFSGMRLNEIAHLETTEVFTEEGMLCLPEGKTESSVRQVPIHPAILPLLERLCDDSKDGFIIPGLKPGGLDKKRGTAVGKRIGRWIRKHVTADTGVVFHGLRASFMQACEDDGIPEPTVQLLVGHARQSLTYGLYSKGPAFPLLREAVDRLHHSQLEDSLQAT